MKIGLVVPGGVDRSGRERVIPALLWLIESLALRNEVVVFALGQEEAPGEWQLLGARVVDLGRAAHRALPGLGVLGRGRQLSRAFREAGPFDVIHAFWASPCGFLATVAAPRRTPVVVSLAGGELAAIPEIGYGCGLVPRERLKVRVALRRAAAVTAASVPMLRAAAAAGIVAELVPLGVEAAGFLPRAPRGGADPFRLLHVGSLNRVKDQSTLLRAFALARDRVPALHLDVVGEDTLGGEVQALALRLGLGEAVAFHGWLSTEEVRPHFARADLLVVSSRHEAGPVALVEAAACGVPSVGTAVGHVLEGDAVRSSAVPVGDAPALAEAIVALATDEELRRRMGEAAHSWARENDAERTAARFEAIYLRVSRARPSVSG
ncbi:MAG TPA: glycosyltransferase family 4 protein [Thermoanaerobaculia bacterium]|nr:glycosyltransferase family 4 protein [Thermoanaerobaculia bacterium]